MPMPTMKTRTWGQQDSTPFARHTHTYNRELARKTDEHFWGPRRKAALSLYRRDRENGTTADNPSRAFPYDGKDTLEKGRGSNDPNYYYLTYTEGPGDKQWMAEKDQNYLARLNRKEAAAEKQKQLALLSQKREPITRALNAQQFSDAMNRCLQVMNQDPSNPIFQALFNTIILKSHQAIVKEFYRIIEQPRLLYVDTIDRMFSQVVHTADIKFPFTLASMVLKSGEFDPARLHDLVVKHLKNIAGHYIYSPRCTALYKIVLKSAQKKNLIDYLTKKTLDGIAENQRVFSDPRFKSLEHRVDNLTKSVDLLWLAVQQNRQAIHQVADRVVSVEQHMVELNQRVDDNMRLLQSQITDLKQAFRAQARRRAQISAIKLALGFIPLIGPAGGLGMESLLGTFGSIADFSDAAEIGTKVLGIRSETLKVMFEGGEEFLKDSENRDKLVKGAFSEGGSFLANQLVKDPNQLIIEWSKATIALRTGNFEFGAMEIQQLQVRTGAKTTPQNKPSSSKNPYGLLSSSSSTSQSQSSGQRSVAKDIATLVLQSYIDQITRVLQECHIDQDLRGNQYVKERRSLVKAIQDKIKEDLSGGSVDDVFISEAIAEWRKEHNTTTTTFKH